jgi:hypothetical protein
MVAGAFIAGTDVLTAITLRCAIVWYYQTTRHRILKDSTLLRVIEMPEIRYMIF